MISGERRLGIINLIELAGSEDRNGPLYVEIDRSLTTVTEVLRAFRKGDDLPHPESKLIQILMPSLGETAKTIMFIHIVPFDDCFKNSIKAMRCLDGAAPVAAPRLIPTTARACKCLAACSNRNCRCFRDNLKWILCKCSVACRNQPA